MEFRLAYRGLLRPNGDSVHKHELRRALHRQMRILWSQLPLVEYSHPPKNFLDPSPTQGSTSLVQPLSGFQFVPLVSERINLIADLNILLLRSEPPGAIVTQGGDIDNRLKTLLDALRMPRVTAEIPTGETPRADESPFFCVLEDDALVTGVSVTSDR